MPVVLVFIYLGLIPISINEQRGVTIEEKDQILERHAYWRADVGLAPLTWSEDMAKLAEEWTYQLKREGCAFYHRPNNSYGENLFMGTVGYYDAGDAIDSWASEKADYDYESNRCNQGKVCGHYTQIVWNNTTEVGCASIVCEGNVIWVCNYQPAGNYVGQKPY